MFIVQGNLSYGLGALVPRASACALLAQPLAGGTRGQERRGIFRGPLFRGPLIISIHILI